MNANRRKRIEKAKELINDAYLILEEIRDEEIKAHDNMPTHMQDESEIWIENLEDATEWLSDAMETLEY